MGTLLAKEVVGAASAAGTVLLEMPIGPSSDKLDSPSRVFKGTVYNRGDVGVTVVMQGTTGGATLSVSGTSGTFVLTWNGKPTAPIAYNANASAIQTALRALPGGSLITVTGSASPFTITGIGNASLLARGLGGCVATVAAANSWTTRATARATVDSSGSAVNGTVIPAKSNGWFSGAVQGRESKVRFLATTASGESEVVLAITDESDLLRR